ncbi:MAG: septum formation protein Maf [Candidatus Melainabacteria bacterium RIFOXYA12_FULL_32_12]|nr:MAG: septum formation protein Maf [Candidatus Melainabacteria bacterium RIFOXYA12_FULL_32_12]
MADKKIILASASPRRKELLANLGLKFEVIPSEIEEIIEGKAFSCQLIEQLALDKVMDVKEKVNYPAIIIGSDTVVVIDNKILGKPKDKQDAFNMLKMLSGTTHEVISAVAITDTETGKTLANSVTSKVTFKELSDSEINNYIATGEPMDKAGAYAIQGIASIFIKSISGCYTNIVGISTYKLVEMLKEFEIRIL